MATNMGRLIAVLSALLATIVVSNCNSHKPEPVTVIRGTVTDMTTGEPIDSASIIVGDTIASRKIFWTGEQGRYEAYPDTIGSIQLFCGKGGYSTEARTVDISVSRFVYNDIDFELGH